jgi:hypothetical protein
LVKKPLRTPHKITERRYRDNIKVQLNTLVTKLPALRHTSTSTLPTGDPDNLAKIPSRALVLASAVEHIESLESKIEKTKHFVGALQQQIKGLQDLVRESDLAIRQHLQAEESHASWES